MLNNEGNKQTYLFYTIFAIHIITNLITAVFTEIGPDEACYWVYSQYPEWGYFDLPPMVAWFIMIGQWFFDGNLGLRLVTILSNCTAIWILWQFAEKYKQDALLFWAVIYSIIIIQPTGFIVTPDAPLFLFSAIFFILYDKYLRDNSFSTKICFAFAIALLLYSKYQALLIVLLTFMSNIKLTKKGSFWGTLLLSAVYLTPHIFWLTNNDFASIHNSINYGDFLRFDITTTLTNIAVLLIAAGPWLGWLFIYKSTTSKAENKLEKAFKYVCTGACLFALISTIRDEFKLDWLILASTPLVVLSYKFVALTPKYMKWVLISGIINFAISLIIRILLISTLANSLPLINEISGKETADFEIKKHAQRRTVIFQDSWKNAALFAYNFDEKKTANISSAFYFQNQYDILDLDEDAAGNDVYIVTGDSLQFSDCDTIVTSEGTWYGKSFDNFHSYYNLTFDTSNVVIGNDRITADLTIHNPYEGPIFIGKTGNAKFVVYLRNGNKWEDSASMTIDETFIASNSNQTFHIEIPLNMDKPDKSEMFLALKINELKPIPIIYDLKGGHRQKLK